MHLHTQRVQFGYLDNPKQSCPLDSWDSGHSPTPSVSLSMSFWVTHASLYPNDPAPGSMVAVTSGEKVRLALFPVYRVNNVGGKNGSLHVTFSLSVTSTWLGLSSP